jgi:serine/threonine protein kinase
MKVDFPNSEGIHVREIKGVDILKEELPPDWYAFANLEIIGPNKRNRQVDIAIIMDDRIMIADIKHWYGNISSDGDSWFQNDEYRDTSPVKKIADNARNIATLLKGHVRKFRGGKSARGLGVMIPFIDHCVILTGECNTDGLDEREVSRVFFANDFCRLVKDKGRRYKELTEPNWIDKSDPLTDKGSHWRHTLSKFFNVRSGNFKPQEKTYRDHRIVSDVVYAHPSDVYAEFDCVEVGVNDAHGLFRLWDFAKAPTKFLSAEYRSDIAGREQQVLAYLSDRNIEFERIALRSKTSDPDLGMNYWEIFERRKHLTRIGEFVKTSSDQLDLETRIDLVRTLLTHAAEMHRMGAAHLDIGPHSVWIEAPTNVRLSHFMVAHYGENRSLAEDRYSFLGHAAVYPEDVFGDDSDHFRRDVFLLGLAAHLILFSSAATASQDGDPPEWDPASDAGGSAEHLYGWFERALSFSSADRFSDADVMLSKFIAAIDTSPDASTILNNLHRYREWDSVFQLYQSMPPSGETIKDDDRVLIYKSETDDGPRLVKMWKSSNWTDEKTDCARLLEFCDRAELLRSSDFPGVARVTNVAYLMDHIALISEFMDQPPLAAIGPEWSYSREETNGFLLGLIAAVDDLHELGIGHGDLSPDNILVLGGDDGPQPLAIDILEFGSERKNPAYSPASPCGAMERDRFAVLKIAEELTSKHDIPEAVSEAILTCREEPPALATLAPLKDALSATANDQIEEPVQEINLMLMDHAATELLAPDEGIFRIYLRKRRGRPSLRIAGAEKEIAFDLTDGMKPYRAKVFPIDHKNLMSIQSKTILELKSSIRVSPSPTWGFSEVEEIFDLPGVRKALGGDLIEDLDDPEAAFETPSLQDGLLEEDAPFEEAAVPTELEAPPSAKPPLDVSHLWQRLIEIELDIFTEAIAEGGTFYSRDNRRHFIPYTLTAGELDFSRFDTVVVKALNPRKNMWFPIGVLDQHLTDRRQLAIDATQNKFASGNSLCAEGALMRFESRMEGDSRTRRRDATASIVNRRSMIPNLIDYFNPHADCAVTAYGSPPDRKWLIENYELNEFQSESFIHIWENGPLGLLQGPPGTGKTKFIAAFVHYAITRGGARNVLLASQSHKAVDNAAEDVLTLFRELDGRASLVRVGGSEADFPDILKPFHTTQVENLYRERFRSRIRENLELAGTRLGLDLEFVEVFYQMAVKLRPLLKQLDAMRLRQQSKDETAALPGYRTASLIESVEGIVQGLPLECPNLDTGDADALFTKMANDVASSFGVTNRESVRRLMMVMRISDDWLDHVGSRRRNFEEFLVGTRQIVSGTCVGLGRAALGLTETPFDLVIVDEAARCTSSELAVPLQSARRVLLVGDQMQLEPFHDRQVIEKASSDLDVPKAAILSSDFERAFKSQFGSLVGRTLKKQYRMLPPIGRLVSEAFYPIGLEHGRPEPLIPSSLLSDALDKPITWVDTSGLNASGRQSYAKKGGTTLKNEAEANAIVELVSELEAQDDLSKWLSEHTEVFPEPIGIICMYRGQKDLITQKLAMAGVGAEFKDYVKVDTVDSYQGKQNLIIILSLVRNNEDGPDGCIKEGFMARENRVNVAISRAMDRLVIVGSSERWPEEGPVSRVSLIARSLEVEGHAEFRVLQDSEA